MLKKNLIRLSSVFLCCIIVSFSSLLQARSLEEIQKQGTLIVAVDGMSPPFNYYKDNKLVGFEIDLIQKIADNLNLKIEWIVQPFATLLTGLQQNRFDIIAASHTITTERSEVVDFIEPHYCNDAVIVTKPDGPKRISDLSHKIIAVAVGTVYYDRLKTMHHMKEIRTVPSEVDGFQALLVNRADVWVTEKPIALGALKNSGQKDNFIIGEALLQQINAMSVAKGNTSLRQAIDQELLTLIKNGTYDSLRKTYLLEDDILCQRKLK